MILTNLKKMLKFLILLILMTGCGFSSGLYKDILKAQSFIEEKEFKKAVSVYEAILLKKPSKTIQIKINYQLGTLYSNHLGDYEKSLIHYKNIVTKSNEPSWQVKALEKIGKIKFENTKKFKEAAEAYLKLVNFEPKLKRRDFYRFRYGLSLYENNQYDEAYTVLYSLTLENDKNIYSIKSYYYVGLIAFYKKNWNEAIGHWYEYLKREGKKNEVIKTKYLIANAYESSEQLKKAYNVYYSIVGEYPNPEVIKERLDSLYKRRVARKR